MHPFNEGYQARMDGVDLNWYQEPLPHPAWIHGWQVADDNIEQEGIIGG